MIRGRAPRSGRRRVGLLVGGIALLLAAAIALSSWPMPGTPQRARAADAPAGARTPAAGEVVIGAYVANIQAMDPATNSFLGDIYVWLRWTDEQLQPQNTLEFLNLYEAWQFTSWTPREEPEPQQDGSQYFVTHYQGAFNSLLSLRDYPFGHQTLEFRMEDLQNESSTLRYITEPGSIAIAPDITIPGYSVGEPTIAVREYRYPTDFGYINGTKDDRFSRAIVSVPVQRPIVTNVIKYLVPIVLVIIAAGLIFQVPPNLVEGRIGLAITALLTLVAMQWTATDGLPINSYLTLLDVLYVVSLAFVLGSLVQALRITWVARSDSEERAIALDERSMKVYLAAYAVAFIAVTAAFLAI